MNILLCEETKTPVFKENVKLALITRFQLHYSLISTARLNDLGVKSETKCFNENHSPSQALLIAPILRKMVNARCDQLVLLFKLLKDMLGQASLHFGSMD